MTRDGGTQMPPPDEPRGSVCEFRPRTWHDLSEDEQERVKRLLTIDPDDNTDDVIARAERAVQIIRGES